MAIDTIDYGLIHSDDVVRVARSVCDVIGYGSKGKGLEMMVETACAETRAGRAVDNYAGDGLGAWQVDKGTVNWLKSKYGYGRHADAIKNAFNISISEVKPEWLRYSPLLSAIFCRLRYLTEPDPIPEDVPGRAAYWKQHYNTASGKGTVKHYQKAATLAALLIKEAAQ